MIAINLDRVRETELAIRMQELLGENILRLDKYHAMRLVGYKNVAAGGWEAICEAFEAVGGNPDELFGLMLPHGDVLITVGQPRALSTM